MEKQSKLGEYDGNGNLDEHVQLVNDRLNYFSEDHISKCKLFALTLILPIMLWFNDLPYGSITSWTDFCERFSA